MSIDAVGILWNRQIVTILKNAFLCCLCWKFWNCSRQNVIRWSSLIGYSNGNIHSMSGRVWNISNLIRKIPKWSKIHLLCVFPLAYICNLKDKTRKSRAIPSTDGMFRLWNAGIYALVKKNKWLYCSTNRWRHFWTVFVEYFMILLPHLVPSFCCTVYRIAKEKPSKKQ